MTSTTEDEVIATVTSVGRMGHISEKGLNVSQRAGKLPKQNTISLGVFEDCIYGKQKAVTFQKKKNAPKELCIQICGDQHLLNLLEELNIL